MKDKALTKYFSCVHPLPLCKHRCHICSSSLVLKKLWQHSCHERNYVLSSQAGELALSKLVSSRDWTSLRCPVQKNTLHLSAKYPTLICHRGQTTVGHRWDPHEAPPVFCPAGALDLECRLRDSVRHGDRKSDFRRRRSKAKSQTTQCISSTH